MRTVCVGVANESEGSVRRMIRGALVSGFSVSSFSVLVGLGAMSCEQKMIRVEGGGVSGKEEEVK